MGTTEFKGREQGLQPSQMKSVAPAKITSERYCKHNSVQVWGQSGGGGGKRKRCELPLGFFEAVIFLRSTCTSLSVSMVNYFTVDHNLQESTALAETTLGKSAMIGLCLQSHKAAFGLSVESPAPISTLFNPNCCHSSKLNQSINPPVFVSYTVINFRPLLKTTV